MVDIGGVGRHSDGGVLFSSRFGQSLDNNLLSLPPSKPLPGTPTPSVPHVFVGDEAFPLKQNMMRPYPGRNIPQPQAMYNFRLNRASKNTFSILASRW